uniref:ATP-dependent RNA helicase n=1 Tax=Panagrolaimus superbus TaxID=310955 RepID=A0A914YC19_9BILA
MTKVEKPKKKTSIKAKRNEKEDPMSQFAPEIGEFFKKTLGFKTFTPVQQCAVKYFSTNYDCIVQAPTGSGKTLAYVLPLMQMLKNKCEPLKENEKAKICALILVPTRDLVGQVSSVMKPIAAALKFQLVAFCSAHKQSEEKKIKGNCIIISTPGRFANLIEKKPELIVS